MDHSDKQSQRLQSNEEVIEELTRDLESSCVKADESLEQNVTSDVCKNNKGVTDDSWDIIDKEDNKNNSNNVENIDLEDVDEELLKNREISLTESEKTALKDEAEILKNKGNALFRDNDYVQAISMYTQALQICPLVYSKERSILYANRAAAKTRCQGKEGGGEKDSAISDCTKAIELNSSYIKAYIRRAQLYEETDKLDEAFDDFKKVLAFDPSHIEANCAIGKFNHPEIFKKLIFLSFLISFHLTLNVLTKVNTHLDHNKLKH